MANPQNALYGKAFAAGVQEKFSLLGGIIETSLRQKYTASPISYELEALRSKNHRTLAHGDGRSPLFPSPRRWGR